MAPGKRAQAGFTFIGMLALLVVVMLGLAIAGPSWADASRRERERELQRIGTLYARALAHYRDASPGTVKQFPLQLDALVLDTRYAGVMRHLRQLYPDPISPATPWGVVRDAQGRITGVYSQSTAEPLAGAAGPVPAGPAGAGVAAPVRRYSDWKFLAPTTP